MTAIQQITERGATVSLAGGKVRIAGLADLPADEARELVEFARLHKVQLLAELSRPSEPELPQGQIRCANCGQPFTPSGPSVAYCGAECFNHVQGWRQ